MSRTGPASALILPIVFRGEALGALLVATDLRDLSSEESLDFARTIGNQIGQVIALRRAFVRMAAAERQYRGIFENAVEGIYQEKPEGRYLLANPTMARIFGYATPEEMVDSVTDIGQQLYVDPADRALLMRQLTDDGSVARFESRGRRGDGTIIWTSQSVRAVRGATGRVQYYEGLLEDITERKKAEATTTALAQTARALLESLDLAAVTRLVTDNVCPFCSRPARPRSIGWSRIPATSWRWGIPRHTATARPGPSASPPEPAWPAWPCARDARA